MSYLGSASAKFPTATRLRPFHPAFILPDTLRRNLVEVVFILGCKPKVAPPRNLGLEDAIPLGLAHHLPTPGVAEVDYGHCLLRLDKGE